jgi:hypothetical protein
MKLHLSVSLYVHTYIDTVQYLKLCHNLRGLLVTNFGLTRP